MERLSAAWALAVVLVISTTAAPAQTLTILSPSYVQLAYRSTLTAASQAPAPAWLPPGIGTASPPAPAAFTVTANGQPVTVLRVGASRRTESAEKKRWSAQVETRVLLELVNPLPAGAEVVVTGPEVTNAVGHLDPTRLSPCLHVSGVGFPTAAVKRAFVARWLGDLGELPLASLDGTPFSVVRADDGTVAFQGTLALRVDRGFRSPNPIPTTLAADFSALTTPGRYQVEVPGFGRSPAFPIDDRVLESAARTYALGLFHQRSGTALAWPDTRWDRGAGHLAPAEIPGPDHPTNPLMAASTADYATEPRHTAPQLSNVVASLYPFQRTGTVDVSGGHHDAGDYSKYTIDSAQLIHELAFVARYVPGAGDLDGLGLPESGDGIGDLWQMALWEADFLSKMQDLDGGFYFLVYPRARRYEDNCLPENADPQVVWPKTTAATAVAVAALAEMSAAPAIRQLFPERAARFREQALAGWNFLTNAIATHGYDGSYQQLTHYGTIFLHDDELCWAASALYVATGDRSFEDTLRSWLPDPGSRFTRRWTWWRLFGGYGSALRTFAFGASATNANPAYLAACREEIRRGALDQANRSIADAWALSFPVESKYVYNAGWFYGSVQAFDLVAGLLLDPPAAERASFESALWGSLGYEWGGNPVNRTFVTGWGSNPPIHPVSQIAENDAHVLPPAGTMFGNLAGGQSWLGLYATNLSRLNYPPDGVLSPGRYPLYERFTDIFNTVTEATIIEQGAGVAVTAALLALQGGTSTPGHSLAATLSGAPTPWSVGSPATFHLEAPGLDLSGLPVTWEWSDTWQVGGSALPLTRPSSASFRLQAEAILPDGRRVHARLDLPSVNRPPTVALATNRIEIALPTCSARLAATVDDDLLPDQPLRTRWEVLAAPGPLNLTDPTNVVSWAAVRLPGEYRLRFVAEDGEFTASAELLLAVSGQPPTPPPAVTEGLVAAYAGDDPANTATNGWHLTLDGAAAAGVPAGFWTDSGGGVFRFRNLGDQARTTLPDLLASSTNAVVGWEARILWRGFKAYGIGDASVLSLRQEWDACLELVDGKWSTGRAPFARAGKTTVLATTDWKTLVPANRWAHLRFVYETATGRATLAVDGTVVRQQNLTLNAVRTTSFALVFGNCDGDLDDIRVFRQ